MEEAGELPEPTTSYQEIRDEIAEATEGRLQTADPEDVKEVPLQAEATEGRRSVLQEQPEKERDGLVPRHPPAVLPEQGSVLPKRKWPQRKRKDITCAKCGKVFSSNARHHKCVSLRPEGIVPLKENEMSPPRETPPPKRARPHTADIKYAADMSPRASSVASPPLTMGMVRSFLTEERTKYRSAQRDAWVGSLF